MKVQKQTERRLFRIIICSLLGIGILNFSTPAYAKEAIELKPAHQESIQSNPSFPTRFVLKTKGRGLFGWLGKPDPNSLLQVMDHAAPGFHPAFVRQFDDYEIVSYDRHLSGTEFDAAVDSLAAVDGVVSIEEDAPIFPTFTPNDEYFNGMSYLKGTGPGTVGIDAVEAWDITTGDPNLNVAVLDTGMQDHPDLAGRWGVGYDFITPSAISGDGDGWDNDPHDTSYTTGTTYSSWHGLHVAGTIGAIGNNGAGTAGLNWQSKIIPVRVLGWGGGWLTDAEAGLRWAAGFNVADVPANPNPARVFNMSFGAMTLCPSFWQATIDLVTSNGGIVVAAAGNNAGDVKDMAPANCNHVIRVANASTEGTFDRDSLSNYGSLITVSAPGENILSTVYDGLSALGNPTYSTKSGTSMAAPHVTGVISLMLSVRPELTFIEVERILRITAIPFPADSDCTTAGNVCGAGLVNAYGAVLGALNFVPYAEVLVYLPLIIK